MKKLENCIDSKMAAAIHDNAEYIAEYETVADYFLIDLQADDTNYYWYLEDAVSADDEILTDEEKEAVERYLKDNYSYKLVYNE